MPVSRPKPLRRRFLAFLAHPQRVTQPDPASARLRLSGALCGYAWPSKANENAMKRRRGIARKAIPELAALGWTVSEYAKNKFEIGRPKATHLLGAANKTQGIGHEE